MGVVEARAAHDAQDWNKAFELFRDAEPDGLEADDFSALADAAWWLGKLDESIAARERAYEARNLQGDLSGAALEAFALSLALGDKGADAPASGWRARAYTLTEHDPESPAAGYLLSMEAVAAFHRGETDECVEKARRTTSIGRLNEDPTLVAWGMHVEGLGLVKSGYIDSGWNRLDESMIAATREGLKPLWVGLMHCGMLVACEEFGDPKRGWQWVEETERWLGSVPGAVLYPGVCRVHKVRILQLRGTWSEAEEEARRACADLDGVHSYTVARAYYEVGEIQRLRGDFDEALASYRKANELGLDPQPGLARLRLGQGRIDEARAGIKRVLAETHDPLIKGSLLPHGVDIALAVGDHDDAATRADELDALADTYGSPLLEGTAAASRGRVLLAEGSSEEALSYLRRALRLWQELGCLYEVASVQASIAEALDALGDRDGASMEKSSAADLFDRIGARPDAERVRGVGKRSVRGLSGREVEVLTRIAAGLSNKQIAADLVISENTVARHVQNIFVKLDVTSRSAAASIAVREGLS